MMEESKVLNESNDTISIKTEDYSVVKVQDCGNVGEIITFYFDPPPLLSKSLEKKFSCKECDKSFYLKNNLDSHLLEHKASKTNLSNQVSNKKSSEKDHILYVEKTRTISKETKLKKAIEKFVRIGKKENEELFCQTCNKNYTNRKTFQRHMQRHRRREMFKCSICGKGSYSQEILDKHVENHSKDKLKEEIPKRIPKSYACRLCYEVFQGQTQLKKHKLIHYKNLSCDRCGKTFSSVKKVQAHVGRHGKPKQCEFCDKSISMSGYKSHIRSHTGERPFKCNQCDASFIQKPHLDRHMIKHWDKESKQAHYAKLKVDTKEFLCDLCGKAFKHKINMNKHYKGHFEDKEPNNGLKKHTITCKSTFTCPVCSEVSTSLSDFNKHKVYHHPEILPSCQICTQKFSYHKLLLTHYLKHSNEELALLDEELQKEIHKRRLELEEQERPHKCSICEKSFKCKEALVAHFRGHTGERPFVCYICGKKFIQDAHLKTHMALHSGEKPYICSVCGKGFAVQNYLYNHEKIHSANISSSVQGRKMFGCHCGKEFATHRSHVRHQKSCTPTIESLLEIDHMETNPGRWVGISILTSSQN